MKHRLNFTFWMLPIFIGLSSPVQCQEANLTHEKMIQIGDKIPSFSLQNQHSEMVSIDHYFGKPYVLYFYPKDDTPGCTAEACSFRDTYSELRDLEAEVIGVSADSPTSHSSFAEKYNLPFVLLSDRGNKVRKMLGVPGGFLGLLPGRVTYIVNKNGVVQHIFDSQLNAKKHVKEALKQLELMDQE